MDDNRLNKVNVSIEDKIEKIKENEKFKLNKQNNLNGMIYEEVEREHKRIEELNKKLDEEISYIYSKIDSANRKWILDDFERYLYTHDDGYTCARIYYHKYAKELKKRLKKFRNPNKNKNIKIVVADKLDYRSVEIDKDLEKTKVITLLKSWVFYSNTIVDYNKTKTYPSDFNKSLMYKIKVSALFFVGLTISITVVISILAAVFLASESEVGSFGFDEIFFFSFGSSRRRNRNCGRKGKKQSGVGVWFNDLKESVLY